MRDFVILGIIIAGSAAALARPWIGVMMWTWVSVMNPHALGWGFITSMPVALIVAAATMIGFVLTREKRNPFSDPAVLCLVLFMGWICVGWPFSYYPRDSWEMLTRVLKIDVMLLLTIALIYRKEHIQWFLWIVAFSIGFYGVKGGIFTLATGGSYRVWGPGGFIEGNNEIALAIILVIPLIYYIYLTAPPRLKWLKWSLLAAMVLCAAAALGSHSRGALLAIFAMSVFLWWRSDRKGMLGVLLLAAGISLVAFMPSNWTERMHTIETYESDGSALGRLNAWSMSFNLANDHLGTGGGFSIYEPEIFAKYAPDPSDVHAAHSIYFQVLGEHGWIGLVLWLAIWWFTWRSASWLRKHGNAKDGTLWCRHMGSMCQVSLIGFAVGGAFLSLAYFDLPYNVMALVIASKRWMLDRQRAAKDSSVPLDRAGAVA
jgi:probable O-glycosylation ligase (exosortase A-associated)